MQSRFSFSHLPWIALLAMGCSTPKDDGKPTASTEPQAQAVERIKQLGGELVWENNDPSKAVVQVHLSRDKVTDADLLTLSAFPRVRVLSLAQTAVTEEGIAGLASLKSLRVLGLSGGIVTDAFLHRLADLEQVEEVEVGDTAVTCAGWAELARMKNLRQLTLLSRHVSDADFPALAKLHQIHSLLLKRATITGEGLSNLSGMGLDRLVLPEAARTNAMLKPYLAALKAPIKRLGLRSWEIDDVGLEHLADLSELTELYLGHTRVGDNGLGQLSGLTKLATLDLGFTQVTDAGLDRLGELTGLKVLILRGSKATENGKKKLAARVPDLEIDPPFEGL